MRSYLRPKYHLVPRGPVEYPVLDGFQRCEVPADLMPVDRLRGLPRDPPSEPGLYCLWHGPQLLYIGYSGDIKDRMTSHILSKHGRRNGKRMPFTHCTSMVTNRKDLENMEYRYINAYLPPYNDRMENTGCGRRVSLTTGEKS